MALTSASTFAEVEAEYRDTAGYRVSASASLALRHAVAIRHLLVMLPSSSVKGANQVAYRVDLLHEELRAAEDYARSLTRTSVIRADFRRFRR